MNGKYYQAIVTVWTDDETPMGKGIHATIKQAVEMKGWEVARISVVDFEG